MRIVVITAIVSIAGLGLACRSAKDYIAQGVALASAGKNADAILLYRKAIQKDSGSDLGYYRLGLVERATGDNNGALASFLQAAALDPGLEGAQIQLGDLYLGAYLNQRVKNEATHQRIADIAARLLAKDPKSAAGLRYRGYMALTDNKPEEAASYFQRVNEMGRPQPDVTLGLIQALWMMGRNDEARKVAHDLIEKNKTFGPVYDVLYAHEMSSGHPVEAEALLKSKIANNPENQAFVIQLGEHYWRMQKRDEAHKLINEVLTSQAPEKIYREVSGFYQRIGELDRAREVLEQGVKAHPGQKLEFQKHQAEILALQGKRDEALGVLDGVIQESPAATDARKARAALLLASTDKRRQEFALKELKILAANSPDETDLTIQLGRAYALNGQPDKAAQQFELVVKKQAGNFPALLGLAELASNAKQFQRSLSFSERLLAVDPRSSQARLLHATALVGLGQLDRARNEYAALTRDEPKFTEAKLQLALLNVAQRKFVEAEKQFREIYRPQQGDFRALKGLVEMYASQGRMEAAITLLTAELARYPEAGYVRRMLAETAARANRPELALQQYEQVRQRQDNDPDVYTEMGKLYQATHNLPKSIAMLEKARELAPNDWKTSARLATVQQEAGLKQQAQSNYERAIQLGADDAELFNNLAYLEAEIGRDLEAAGVHAQKALQKSPANPSYADTVGFVYLKKNQTASALQVFKALTARFPKEAIFRYHLALALRQNGDVQGAGREFRAALQADGSLALDPSAQSILREYGLLKDRAQ